MIFIVMTILLPLLAALGILISPWWPVTSDGTTRRMLTKENPWINRSSHADCMRQNRLKFGIFIGGSIVASGLICGLLYFGATRKMHFNEVWNYKITSIEHHEKWTTREMRTRQVPSGTDSKGNIIYRTETYYVTETHGPYWYANDEYGRKNFTNEDIYNYWAKFWNNQRQTGIHKGSSAGWGNAITGRIFQCDWLGTFETIYPWSEINSYVNKVRVSRSSVFNLAEPTKEQLKKYPRPADEKNARPVITYGPSVDPDGVMFIRRVNANFGVSKQIHALIVVFNAKDGRESINDVLTAWRGPNKNELVIFVGLEADRTIKWCEVHSWMDNTTLHAMVRDGISGKKFDLVMIGGLLNDYIPKHWHRKHFRDFEYLKIDIHWGWCFTGFMLIVLIMAATFFVVEYKIEWE